MHKSISRRNLIKKFREHGFSGPYSGGKHEYMTRGNQKVMIPNPHGSNIGAGLLKRILKEVGIEEL